MKKFRPILLALLFGLVGCTASVKTIDVDEHISSGHTILPLSTFSLDNPLNDAIVSGVEEFSWGASKNAESYTLEICSNDQFISNIETIDYYKRDNITTTSFKFTAAFAYKEVNYYWRVTAVNAGGSLQCKDVFHFYVKAPEVEEVHFDLGESDDWQLHQLGSYADVTVDNSNFFGNGEKTLKISFKEEDTHRGNEESDGWIVVSKTIEKSIYGTDALYFNSFYAGQDATVVIRLVDRDNEYWCCQVQVSNNAKQSVILRFSDFWQRTKDVVVANRVFDFERIKYLEVVFEQSFGDGVYLMSGMKAIKFDNYKNLFIDKLNFSDYDSSRFVNDHYQFEYEIRDDYELVLSYYGTNDQDKPKIDSYGFVKLNVNRYMFTGNAVKISVKYSGKTGTNVLLRIYEEDTDRWSFKIPFSKISDEEYTTLIIPYNAFAYSQILGDGKRQFYFILNIQFGLEGEYGTGQVFFKDFEVVNMEDYQEMETRSVPASGLVENFESYTFNSELYFVWTQSDVNKDEYMALNTTAKVGSHNNACGQFEYKADMEAAVYYLPVKVEGGTFSSLSLWLKDASIKSKDDRASYIENYSPDVGIYIRLATGEIYEYKIKSLARMWNEYNIPFGEEYFKITNEDSLRAPKKPIEAENITHIGISLYFKYIDASGKEMRLWANNNPVYIDNIYLKNDPTYRMDVKEKVITMDDTTHLAMIDDFESYKNNDEMLDFWMDGKSYEYQEKELTDDVSSEGGEKAISLLYQSKSESPSYFVSPAIDKGVNCRTFRINMKSERPATVYINLYVKIGSSETQYRATINSVKNVWTEYIRGFSYFKDINNTSESFNTNYYEYITRISIGVVFNGGSEPTLLHLFVDNMAFDGNSDDYEATSVRVIDQ